MEKKNKRKSKKTIEKKNLGSFQAPPCRNFDIDLIRRATGAFDIFSFSFCLLQIENVQKVFFFLLRENGCLKILLIREIAFEYIYI